MSWMPREMVVVPIDFSDDSFSALDGSDVEGRLRVLGHVDLGDAAHEAGQPVDRARPAEVAE